MSKTYSIQNKTTNISIVEQEILKLKKEKLSVDAIASKIGVTNAFIISVIEKYSDKKKTTSTGKSGTPN